MFQISLDNGANMMGPDSFQYKPTTAPILVRPPSNDGLIELARGWFDAAGNLVRPRTTSLPTTSPTTYQYTSGIPAVRSPTSFQYGGTSTSAPRTSTTVDVDGGTRLFQDLKNAAKETLLTRLDDAISGFSGQSPAAPMQVNAQAHQSRGLPIGAILAVAVVGGIIYMKFG